MSAKRIVLTSVLGVSALLLMPPSAMAKQKTSTSTKKPPQQSQNNHKNTLPPAAPADSADQKEVSADETQVAKDQAALNDLTDKLKAKFDASPDAIAANASLKSAMSAYDTERQTLLASLQSKPEYKKALADKQAAQEKVDDLRKTDGSSPEAISEAATASLNAGKAVTQMESDALTADSKAVSLKSDLTAASDKVAALKKQFADECAKDHDWSTAKTTLDTDQAKLAEARKKLST